MENKMNTYRYELVHNGEVVRRGITSDLTLRENVHQYKWPGSKIKQIDDIVTRKEALYWIKFQDKTCISLKLKTEREKTRILKGSLYYILKNT